MQNSGRMEKKIWQYRYKTKRGKDGIAFATINDDEKKGNEKKINMLQVQQSGTLFQ